MKNCRKEAGTTSGLSPGKIDKYEYLTGGGKYFLLINYK